LNLGFAQDAARQGHLYPAVILHGGNESARQDAALRLARTLLCAAAAAQRPCGVCSHCRRMVWPGGDGDEQLFHPDFVVLRRDLKTATSVDATRDMLRTAQFSPFEARGQVFVVANAETLSGEAANALLKNLEEPATSAPRHFLLLAPSRLDLLPTLRSRSLAVFLGPAEPLDDRSAAEVAARFGSALSAYLASGAGIHLLTAAEALGAAGGWEDPRSPKPWAVAAAAVSRTASEFAEPGTRRRCLALAEALLAAPQLRMRGIMAERILDGLVARHLAAAPVAS
jgi:hypothetical protein